MRQQTWLIVFNLQIEVFDEFAQIILVVLELGKAFSFPINESICV